MSITFAVTSSPTSPANLNNIDEATPRVTKTATATEKEKLLGMLPSLLADLPAVEVFLSPTSAVIVPSPPTPQPKSQSQANSQGQPQHPPQPQQHQSQYQMQPHAQNQATVKSRYEYNSTKSLTATTLATSYPVWIRQQRQQLCRFFEMTRDNPTAKFTLPLPFTTAPAHAPVLATATATTNGKHSQQAKFPLPTQPRLPITRGSWPGQGSNSSSSNLCFTRAELLSLMCSLIKQFYRAEVAKREQLAEARLVCEDTRWRWKKERQQNYTGALTKTTTHLYITYQCLAEGVTLNKNIAARLNQTFYSARLYKYRLLDSLLVTLLTGLEEPVRFAQS